MIQLDPIQQEILVEGLDDYVGLWQVASRVRESLRESPTTDSVRQRVLKHLRPLLERGFLEAGNLAGDGGFVPWEGQGREALDSIGRAWTRLGRDPNIGYGPDPSDADSCWFRNTPAGSTHARQLGA